MAKKFQKKFEDFTCEQCDHQVKGTGYTDHCPHCLTSKHVDNNPGDRENSCCGLMKIERIEIERGEYILNYYCTVCGAKKRNKVQEEDNFDELIKIQKKLNDQIAKG
jgi:hypothetical protein